MDEKEQSGLASAIKFAAAAAVLCVVLLVGGGFFAFKAFVGPPVPGPTPSTPTANLSSLVPEPEARAKLARFYADFALVLRSESCPLKTTADFREAQRLAATVLQDAARLPTVDAINEPISKRIEVALGGLDNKPLSKVSPGLLANTLEAISQEFGG